MSSKYNKLDFNEIIKEYNNGASLSKLAPLYNINISSLRYHLLKRNVKIRNVKESVKDFFSKKELIFSDEFKEFIIGCLLGDGGLRIHKKGKNPQFNYTDKHIEVINYVSNILKENDVKYNISFNKKAKCYCIYTEYRKEFMPFYNLFYPSELIKGKKQKRKILPNVILSKISLLWWFIGDGSSIKINKWKNHRGQIACKYYNQSIIEQLCLITKSKCAYYKYNNKNGITFGNYHINNSGFINFLKYIGDCPFECYKYKWIIRENE